MDSIFSVGLVVYIIVSIIGALMKAAQKNAAPSLSTEELQKVLQREREEDPSAEAFFGPLPKEAVGEGALFMPSREDKGQFMDGEEGEESFYEEYLEEEELVFVEKIIPVTTTGKLVSKQDMVQGLILGELLREPRVKRRWPTR